MNKKYLNYAMWAGAGLITVALLYNWNKNRKVSAAKNAAVAAASTPSTATPGILPSHSSAPDPKVLTADDALVNAGNPVTSLQDKVMQK